MLGGAGFLPSTVVCCMFKKYTNITGASAEPRNLVAHLLAIE